MVMKKYINIAIIAFLALMINACEKNDNVDFTASNPALNKQKVEFWHCYGKYYEYIGDGSDTSTFEDPVNNSRFREYPDTLFKITIEVLRNQNVLYSKIENYRNINLCFADRMWYGYDTLTYANTNLIFSLLTSGRDTSNMTVLNTSQNSFRILRLAQDTVSLHHIYTGPMVGEPELFNFYMFVKDY